MRVDTATFAAHNALKSKEPRYVIVLSFDSANSILWYFTSHADAALPGGGGVTASVIESLSGTSQTLSPDQANATIGNISFDVVDKVSAITAALGTQLALGRSTRQQRVQVYMGYKGDAWVDYTLIQTQFVTEIGYQAGKYTFRCQDVQRVLRKDIFTQAVTPLSANVAASPLTVTCTAGAAVLNVADATSFPASGSGTIRDSTTPANDNDSFTWTGKTATTLTGCSGVLAHVAGALVCDATVNVIDTSKFTLVAHGTSYSDAPSATVGYIRVDSEVIRYSGKTSTTFTGCVRGALNTVAAAHAVDLTQVIDQRTLATEYVYLELPAVDLMYRLLTGLDRLGNPALPTGWNLGVSPAYVRLSDFTGIGRDLWDLTDDLQGFPVRFEDLTKTDGKKFIETELALLLGVFMPIYADGSLGCRRMANILAGAAYVDTLTEANVLSCGELRHDMTTMYNVIQISWNWEPLQKEFTRVNVFLDQPSITIHKQAPTLKLAFRGLHGSRHSPAMLAGRFDMIRDRYTAPPLRLTSKVLHRFNSIEIGDVLRNRMRTVRDFVANGPLDRSFEVQGIAIDWVTGALNLTQFASSRAPSPLPATGDATVIASGWYSSAGTLLATGVGGIMITGSNPGHITVGGTLAGNADLTNAAAIYYYLGDLQLDATVNLNISQNVQLRILGNFTNNGTINGKGAGLAGAVSASPDPNTYFGVRVNSQVLGTAAFLGTTEAGGGTNNNLSTTKLTSIRSGVVRGLNPAMPEFNINWNGVGFSGLPVDLRGCSGSSGVNTGIGGISFVGGAGGNGGAGLLIVSRGFAQGSAGRIDLSGSDGVIGESVLSRFGSIFGFGYNHHAGSGAGGAPGGMLVLLDGAAVTATGLTDAGFVALTGKTPQPAGAADASVFDYLILPNGNDISSYYVGTGDGTTFALPSLSGARGGSRVQYVLNNAAGATPDPVVTALPAPISMGLVSTAAELLLPGFGVALSRIKVTWTPVPDDRVVGYDLQYKLSTDTVWQSAPSVLGQGANVAYLDRVVAGQPYDVQLRSAGATREVSTWIVITGFPVFSLLAAVPADVTGFSASQQGVVVAFNWDRPASDYSLKGFDIGFAPQGTTDWNLFVPLTEAAKGTEMTNASVPPGTWTFGIRARNTADQLSAAPAFFNLVVTNANPLISQLAQERDWLNSVLLPAENLLAHPSDLDDAFWFKTACSITANTTIAPDGTTTADKIIEDGTSASHSVSTSFAKVAAAIQYTASVYVKAAGRTHCTLQVQDGTNVSTLNFNLGTGVIDSTSHSGTWTLDATSVTALPNGWYRISLTATSSVAALFIFVLYLADAAYITGYAGNGVDGIYAWGMHLKEGPLLCDGFVRHPTGVLVPRSTKRPSDYPVISAPAAPTLGTTPGGALALTTYFVKVAYVSPAGAISPPAGETLASAEASQLVLLNNLLTVASPAPATGASAYNVYVSTVTNTETLQNAAPIPLGTSWTEPASGLVSGRALPALNRTGFEPFDIFVPDPVSSAGYTAPQVDIGYDDAVRVFAAEAAAMGPGQSGTPGIGLLIDTWLSAASDLGAVVAWVLGTVTLRYLRARLSLSAIVAGAVPYVTSFVPTVDKAPVIEHADSVTVGATGTAIVFPTPFHVVPNVQVTPISAGVTSASATSVTTTGFTAHVFNGGTETGGTINWVATGE